MNKSNLSHVGKGMTGGGETQCIWHAPRPRNTFFNINQDYFSTGMGRAGMWFSPCRQLT